MQRLSGYHREIALKPSVRSRALNAVLRLAMGKPLAHDTDVVALRRRYERIDARQFRVDPEAERSPVECGGVPGEAIWVPETRAERTLLYLHGGSFAFRFPNAHAGFAARLCRRLHARPSFRITVSRPASLSRGARRLPRGLPRFAGPGNRAGQHRAGG
jgi:hypothetical protein